MGLIEKRRGDRGYRARYRDPLGEQRLKTFVRNPDAQRFLLEMESDKARGRWIEASQGRAAGGDLGRGAPASVPQAVAHDAGGVPPRSSEYVLPRFGAYRLGRIPAEEVENWLNDEIDAGIAPSSVHRHYRTLRRMLQGRRGQQKILTNPCARVQPPAGAEAGDGVPLVAGGRSAGQRPQRPAPDPRLPRR